MRKSKRIIYLVSVVVISMCSLMGCSNSNDSANQYENSDDVLYSREQINHLSSRAGFGRGRADVETLILSYIYSDRILAEKYGDSFLVENFGGMDSGSTFLVSWLYEGTGKYYVEIDGDTWYITAKKGYWGKWKVTDCYQEVNN